jgi:ligand-binding sensor domain-containing protein/signal transduction histidine kinase
MFRRLRSRSLSVRWLGAALVGFIFLLAQRAEAQPRGFGFSAEYPSEALVNKPVVGRNADGYLEVFAVDAQGDLRHRWQKPLSGDWSSWASLGGPFEPGIAVLPDSRGRLCLFAVDRATQRLWHAHQTKPGSIEWSEWLNLGGTVAPPLAAMQNQDGRQEVFAVDARRQTAIHLWETTPGGPWSPWAELDGSVLPGLAVARNKDGRLELFGREASRATLLHCWQLEPNSTTNWSGWMSLGGSLAPGFATGVNSVGVMQVFGVNPSNHLVMRIRQLGPGRSGSWSAWEDFGNELKAEVAVGQSADARLEIIGVAQTNASVVHRWELFVNGADQWSDWADMNQPAAAPVGVGQNEDGNLELFAADPADSERVNHRRQISRASDWLDWSSLDERTFRYNSRTWQTDEGLPANDVKAITQTADGYLWVGTSAGLARFDGLSFATFDSSNTPELKSSSITALCAEPGGTLWIGTAGGGLVRYSQGQFARFTHVDGLAGDQLNTIYENRAGVLWIGTTTGMSCYANGRFTNYTTRQGLWSDNVRAIYEGRDGNLWLATGAGLNRLDGQRMISFPMPNGLPNDSVRAICQDRGGRIWIGSNNGMLWYSSVWTNFYAYNAKYGLSDTFVSAIAEDREANLWVGTYSGLNRYHEGRFFPELNNEGMPYDRVNALFQDREGDMWVGSREGLVRLTPKRFVTYTRRQGLTHNNVTSVLEDHAGSLWLGTWGGGLDQLKDDAVTSYAETNVFAQGLVLALCETRDGGLWFGSDFDGGLSRLQDGEFTHYTWKNGLLSTPIRVLYEDRAGTLWIGTGQGLCAYKAGRFSSVTNRPAPGTHAVHAICEDDAGALWFGTDAGLSCLHQGEWTNYSTSDGLSGNNVLSLYVDEAQDLWVGTADSGLNRFHNAKFSACGTKQGLFSDEIFAILEDDHGWLWMSCSKGVFRVRKAEVIEVLEGKRATVTSIEYGKADGLESTQCSGVAKPGAWKSRDGRLWFPTSKGLATVDPNTIQINTWAPPVVIEQVLGDKRPVQAAHRSADFPPRQRPNGAAGTPATFVPEPSLQVPPGRGELEFHYTALSLQAPETCRFRYRLDGVDGDWVDAGVRRIAHYNNIYPGHYTFRVIACNKDGIWNQAGVVLAVSVRPHLWQTWWCRGLGVLLLVGIVGGSALYVTRKRMRRELERLEQTHAIEKERGRIAKDIHDDLGSSLTRIMMLGERAHDGLARHEEVGPHLSKIVASARDSVKAMDEIVWAVNPENDTLEGLVEYLSHYADEFFEDSPVSCRLEIPVQLPERVLPAEVRHDLFLSVKEAFHNVLKHAQASQVRVELSTSDEALQICVEDNGRGFQPGNNQGGRKGNGLGNIDKRLKSHRGRFTLESTPGHGTQVKICVPLPGQRGG